DVALRVRPELLRVAGVEPWHPATDLTLGQIAREAVALEDAHHRLADVGLLVLDEAGREQRNPPARARASSRAAVEPLRETHAGEGGKLPVAGDARDLLHEEAHRLHVGGRVHDRRERRRDLALEIGAGEE